MTNDSRLLVLACSQRKRKNPELLPAIERYDGPAYQITRKYLNSIGSVPCRDSTPSIFILSAQYGLIAADTVIPHYDRKMTPLRAQELKLSAETRLQQVTEHNFFSEMLFCMGKMYQTTLSDTLSSLRLHTRDKIAIAEGSIGKQSATLYDWLFKAPPPIEQTRNEAIAFRGTKITITREKLLEEATFALADDPPAAARFESWYVLVGQQRVAPKWLFSLLTGLPVSQFRTADARRVLTALGIDVKRATL